jgi:hypothetical protein
MPALIQQQNCFWVVTFTLKEECSFRTTSDHRTISTTNDILPQKSSTLRYKNPVPNLPPLPCWPLSLPNPRTLAASTCIYVILLQLSPLTLNCRNIPHYKSHVHYINFFGEGGWGSGLILDSALRIYVPYGRAKCYYEPSSCTVPRQCCTRRHCSRFLTRHRVQPQDTHNNTKLGHRWSKHSQCTAPCWHSVQQNRNYADGKPRVVKNFPAIYGNWMLITARTATRPYTAFWLALIHSTFQQPIPPTAILAF